MIEPWEHFSGLRSPDRKTVAPGALVDMSAYRLEERKRACGGADPIAVLSAYAQDTLVYSADGTIRHAGEAAYRAAALGEKVNRFGRVYRKDAKLCLYLALADIVVDAAIHLHRTQGWTAVLFDGLRTMDAHCKMHARYREAVAKGGMPEGLLAKPGSSAHNKGMAIDGMMFDAKGREVDVGGHFDHLDMEAAGRNYQGPKLSEEAAQNRRIREAAFQRAALSRGMLIAPLRSEFWDERFPENHEDLWRVLESVARAVGIQLLAPEDEKLRLENREAFRLKWERWTYDDFKQKWAEVFMNRQHDLAQAIGYSAPPETDHGAVYHGAFNPLYDHELMKSGKHLTDDPHLKLVG